ncbi:MAG TPA: hypothetical protein VNR66_15555 [Solirubrobacteraceae bacterium]|nr:hypothetical protein [Solirubrobacteraceae bacterium]
MLESFYEVDRPRIAVLMRSTLALGCIETLDGALLRRALELYELDRLDFAEAHLVAQAEATGVAEIVPFDGSIDRVDSVHRREP